MMPIIPLATLYGSSYDAHPNVTRERKPLSYRRRFTGFIDHDGKRIYGGDVLEYGSLCYHEQDPLVAAWIRNHDRVSKGDAADVADNARDVSGWIVGGNREQVQRIGRTLKTLLGQYTRGGHFTAGGGGWHYVQLYVRVKP